jgi:trimeric autotransporter adhesin
MTQVWHLLLEFQRDNFSLLADRIFSKDRSLHLQYIVRLWGILLIWFGWQIKNHKIRFLLLCYLSTIGGLALNLRPVLAASAVAGEEIENQATGSFIDPNDNTERFIESDIVKVRVVEVAGIFITSNGYSGTPYPGTTVYFNFTITNTGNDPTQFYIPNLANITGNATQGNIQIVGYNHNGSTPVTLPTPITIGTGAQTGSNGTAGNTGLLGNNGIFQPGGSVSVRVPITINTNATHNDPISVLLGDTAEDTTSTATPKDRLQNQVYTAGSNDVHTIDNPDSLDPTTSAGKPMNGDTTQGRQEASAIQSTKVALVLSISGKVFEDINYGGGAGRSLADSAGIGRPNVRVELYDDSDNYVGKTFTDTNGNYTFNSINTPTLANNSTYKVRVVNSFVTSSRGGACSLAADVDTPPASCLQIPVQTFRTNGVANSIGVADPNRVGGENPEERDALINTNNSTLSALNNVAEEEAQSISSVTIVNNPVSGIDFGYNFDTIVNTKNSGQGSLRQFIINSNSLTNTGLDQAANSIFDPAAEVETSIFMIPSNKLNSGIAVINITSTLPTIADSKTSLNGVTQTANIGDTNSDRIGTGGTVGVDGIALAKFDRPEVEIAGNNVLTATGTYTEIKNIAFNGQRITISGSNSLVADNLVGMNAIGTTNATSSNISGHGIEVTNGNNITIRHNYVRVNESGIRRNGGNPSGTTIEYNEVDLPSSGQGTTYDGILLIGSGTNENIRFNSIKNMRGAGIELGWGGTLTGTKIENNTIDRNGYNGNIASTETMGVVINNAGNSQLVLSKNIIKNNSGAGVLVMNNSRGAKITQNSIFNNGTSTNGTGLGIDLDSSTVDPNAYNNSPYTYGVTPNDGVKDVNGINRAIDYPVITYAGLSAANVLTLRGYVGKEDTPGSGDADFANVTVEFFVADDDGNNHGPVFANMGTNTINKPHGEGRNYLGSCTTDNDGKFSCNLSLAATIDPQKITATATDSLGNTSEFSATPNSRADLLIVKRITAINGTPINTIIDDPNSTKDNHANWPANYLVGAIDGGRVKPKDEIEYTIYYLNSGENNIRDARICDRLNANFSFQTQFDINDSGTIGKGISFIPGITAATYLTNASDSDRGFLSTSSTLPTNCNLAANTTTNLSDDVVVVDVASGSNRLLGSIGAGNPAGSYGKIKFKVKVKDFS